VLTLNDIGYIIGSVPACQGCTGHWPCSWSSLLSRWSCSTTKVFVTNTLAKLT